MKNVLINVIKENYFKNKHFIILMIFSGYGDASLFSGLQPLINRGLPQEATEWRR